MTDEDKFAEWLKSNSNQPLIMPLKRDKGSDVYIRAAKTDQFDYLYRQRVYGADGINRYNNFAYAGIYSKIDETLYDFVAYYDATVPTNASERTAKKMMKELIESVQSRVEAKINNDRRNLTIKQLPVEQQEKLAEFKRYYLSDKIKELFLAEILSEEIRYNCEYKLGSWNDSELLNYISDTNSYTELQANKYLSANQENILLQFEENELLTEGLQELEGLEDSATHRLRNIIKAMKDVPAKTVTVTVNKNGEEYTFRTLADELRGDPRSYYSTWNILSNGRLAFEEKFGHCANYRPEEIIDITYRGKSIYSAEPFEEQAEVQGLKLTL